MTLHEFLLARIADDEKWARRAARGGSGVWGSWNRSHEDDYRDLSDETPGKRMRIARLHTDLDEHIATHSPARVLAECAAKRKILDLHKTRRAAYPGTTIESDPCCGVCSAGGEYVYEFPCSTLRILALPYADHPDAFYITEQEEEWRP